MPPTRNALTSFPLPPPSFPRRRESRGLRLVASLTGASAPRRIGPGSSWRSRVHYGGRVQIPAYAGMTEGDGYDVMGEGHAVMRRGI